MTYEYTPKAQAKKQKYKWDYLKLKIFFTEKGTINKMQRRPMDGGGIFASHIQGLSRRYPAI